MQCTSSFPEFCLLKISGKHTHIIKANLSYYQIDKQEVLKGFQLCQANAKNQFDSALNIKASNTNTGPALLVLGAVGFIHARGQKTFLLNLYRLNRHSRTRCAWPG